jgi:hypothetical protein
MEMNWNSEIHPENSRCKNRSEIVEHQATVKSSAEALHHEAIFQFCYHLKFKEWVQVKYF